MIADMVGQVSSKWWTFLVRGIAALALAAWAFSSPGTMAAGLVYVFAAYFIISGVAEIVAGFSFTGVGHWWALVFLGIVSAFLGFIMLAEPGAGPLALAFFFAIYLMVTGLTEITAAVQLRSVISNEFWYVLLGLITLAIGIYVILRPDLGLLALIYTIGIYAVLAGIALIA